MIAWNCDYSKNFIQADITTGGIMSEVTGGDLLLQNNIPNLYPKLLHPVHDNHKILIAILKVKKL